MAASIGLAAVTLGTETDGSITCPASYNNVAGIKPTLGLTSRAGGELKCDQMIRKLKLTNKNMSIVIPITEHQDTIGPIVRSMSDAAIVLSVIAGPDPNDNFTLTQPQPVPDFTKALNKNALAGKRIGVPRTIFLNESITGNDPAINIAFEEALDIIRALGATVVDPADLPSAEEMIVSNNETLIANVDFKVEHSIAHCLPG